MKHSELTKEYLELVNDHVEMLVNSITDNYCHLDDESKKIVSDRLHDMRDNLDELVDAIDFEEI